MSGSEGSPRGFEQERAELEAVLGSKIFARAPSLAKLLSYLCGKYFDGEADQIKEYTIAVEFFKKEEDFASKDSPIVRVEAGRLRAKLREYYHTEGKNDSIEILIASGQYAPVFQHQPTGRSQRTTAEERGESGTASEDIADLNEYRTPIYEDGSQGEEGLPQAHSTPSLAAKGVSRSPRASYIAAFSIVGLAFVITAILLLYHLIYRTPTPPAQASAAQVVPMPVANEPEGAELRIAAGSSVARYADKFGKVWISDRFYSGGEVLTPTPAALERAENSHLCKQGRVGDFEYAIPLSPGVYELHLYFAELQVGFEPEEGGETSRIFHVFANERRILDSFDVFSDAEGCGKVDERVFTDISPSGDGRLHLAFRSARSKAIVNGLGILPGTRGKMRPVRIVTRSSPYLASDQQLWEPDRYFTGGRAVIRLNPVAAVRDPELYQSERFGNFTYTIPVAPGQYRLTLKFAETYFGTPNPLHVGPLNRLFDVYCNGQTLLKEFDISREAGGVNRSIDRVFHRMRPNAQGKLVLTFEPVVNYACVNAIEIIPE